jgi:HEAT repeat protein
MKRRLAIIALAVVAMSLAGALPRLAHAQSAPTSGAGNLQDQVLSLVGRFPGDAAAVTTALCAELVALGPAGLARTCALVLPPGAGNDAKARFALNGLAVHVTRAGAEAERQMFVKTLLAAAAASPDKNVAAFFLTQVQLAGREEAVKPLARYLTDKDLAGPAATALQAIGGRTSARVLLKALDAAPLSAKLSIVDAIGALCGREAVRKLIVLSGSPDEGLRRAARAALAEIGDPSAAAVLANIPVTASPRERSAAPGLYLLFARRLAAAGKTDEALAAARAVLGSYTRADEGQVASDALSLIVSILGVKAVPDLLAAVDSPAAGVGGAALEMAVKLGDGTTTGQWIAKAGAATPGTMAAIIAMLGRRGDGTALPFVREMLKSPEEAVRLAAIPAAARLGGQAVVADLFGLFASASEATVAAAGTALLGFDARYVVPEAARRLEETPLPGKTALIELLGEKGARSQIERFFKLASDPDPAVRGAALGALAKVVGESDLPRLVAMLEKATDGEDIVHLQEAVAAAAVRVTAPARRGAALVELMAGADPGRQAVILRVLPRVGGAKALAAAVAETAAPDSQVQTAAVYALSQWPDFVAADELLHIATTTASKRYRLLALDGYVRLVGRANMTGSRRLGLLQDLLARPFDDADKKAVVTGIAAVREPEALHLLADGLDKPDLGDTAAAGLLELASEQAPQERWLSGHEAYAALRRVQVRAAADPAEYARIGALIDARLRQGGFVPLFDGRTLEGWKGLVADPPARARMTPDELATAQAAADDRMRAHWKVVDGVLVFDGRGESLCTRTDYGDFELLVDWRIDKGGDSGLYLRGSPQVQIWDPDTNPVGSGGLYNNQKGKSAPAEKADRAVGEWNSFRIVMIGDRVSVYLNDKFVVDNVVLENYWERDKPIYATGQIELQAHGNPLRFRNIYVREIPRDIQAPSELSEAESDEGFVALFNGRDLDGWTGDTKGYTAENGKIVIHPELGSGNLYTAREYSDFTLRFEFKLTPAANNGLGVRAPLEGDAAYVGMEVQILEDGSPVYWNLRPYQYHGSIYGVVPARRGFLKPPGEWNAEEVTVIGRHVTVVVNGTTIVDADLDRASAGGTIDHNEHPGLKRASGHLGFLGHGAIVEFRAIRLKEIR